MPDTGWHGRRWLDSSDRFKNDVVMRRSMRFVLILMSFGAAFFFRANPLFAVLFSLSGMLLIYGHVRYGSVVSAFRAVRRGRLDLAQACLKETRLSQLSPSMAAYAEWVRAAIAESEGRAEDAIAHMRAADRPALPKDDRVVLRATLAVALARAGQRGAAQTTLESAHGLGPSAKAAALLDRAARDMKCG